MSTVNATVTTGYEFTLDEAGKAQVTVPRLNLLGVPTVTSDMSDSIALVDLKDAVKQLMPKLSVVAGAVEGDGTMLATIQVQDADGNSIANEYILHTWMSDSDLGAPHAMTTSFARTTGQLIKELTAATSLIVQTDSSGTVVMDINDGAGIVYIMASINGLVFSAQLNIT